MFRKTLLTLAVVFLCGAAFATPARAQQTLSFNVGYFQARGEDARVAGDVLNAELGAGYEDALLFRVKDFNGATVGGDYLISLGDFLDAGFGLAYYSRSVPSVSAHYVEDNGAEIEQTLRLRIIPITATVRFLPLGRHGVVEPYIGAGIGFFNYRYTETGRFVNPADLTIYTANPPFLGSGWATGPVIMGGVRVPVGGFAVGFEVNYQRASGDLPTDQFLGNKIDLSGLKYQATFAVRF